MRNIPVHIEGAWRPVAYVGHVLWEGVATAEEPITALALGRDPSTLSFARAGRSDTLALHLRLAVSPDEPSESRHHVRVHLSIGPQGSSDGSGTAILSLSLRLTSAAPFMFSLNHHRAGAPAWFARAWSAERTEFGALFVAVADTRSARNRLWHLRDGVEAPDLFAAALARGRSGSIETER
jgi:hypothetical protein